MITDKIPYNTRDKDGKDITQTIEVKTYPTVPLDIVCPLCGVTAQTAVDIKDIVSDNFTDWQFIGGRHVCAECAKMFTFYRYSYIVNDGRIRLLNIREMAQEIQKPQEPPFKIVASVSQKKHLFYKAVFNNDSENFYANLEEETILCNLEKLREHFTFVGSLQALGESKKRLAEGVIRFDILEFLSKHKLAQKALAYLKQELKTRQIQIPLYLSQKPNITQEEAVCNMDSTLNR